MQHDPRADSLQDDARVASRRIADELAALSLTLDAGAAPEVQLERVGHLLLAALSADCAVLALYNESRTRAAAWTGVGLTPEEQALLATRSWPSPAAVPVERELQHAPYPIVRATPADLERYPDPRLDVLAARVSDIVVPLVDGEVVHGIAYVWRRDVPAPFGESEFALATACGRFAGQGIASARQVARLHALEDIGRRLARTHNLDELYRAVYLSACNVLAVDLFSLALHDPVRQELHFPLVVARGKQQSGLTKPMDGGVTSTVIRTGESLLLRARGDYPDEPVSATSILRPLTQSSLHVPLRSASEVFGVISVQSYEPDTYQQADLEVLETMALQVAVAIENARLYDAVAREREHVAHMVRWQQSLIHGSRVLSRGGNITSLIDAIAGELEAAVPHHSLAIYVTSSEPGELQTIRVRAAGEPLDTTWTLQSGQGLVGYAVLEGRPLLFNDAHLDPRVHYPDDDPADRSEGESFLAAPLIVDGATVGAVGLSRPGTQPFSLGELEVFSAFVPQLAIAIETARLIDHSRSLLLASVRALIATIDAKDPLARGHSERVSRLARDIAARLDLRADEQAAIELAGLLHDVGKLGIPDEILSKPGPLTAAERAMMMAHAALGADILAGVGSAELARLVPLVRHHHEWYYGGGYPDGVAGEAIPLGAAIIAVADAFDTMTTVRPYRAMLDIPTALAEVRRSAGSQFHPDVADALASVVETSPLPARAIHSRTGDSHEPVSRITPIDVRPVSVLYRIASEIGSISDLDAFLARAVQIISDELNYSNVSILLPDDEGQHLVVRADIWPDKSTLVGWQVPIAGSLTGWVLRTGQVINIGDAANDTRYFPGGATDTVSEIAAPLLVDGRTVGVINVESPVRHAFTALDERMLVAIAAQIAPALQLARVHDEVKRAAQRDGLTGIYNHAAFYSRLEQLLDAGETAAVFIFDVEGLKRVNDTAGHLAGDNVLRRIAITLEIATRPKDIVARYGGDEFAVIATGVDLAAATEMATRLQQEVNRLTWGAGAEHIRISVGMAISGVDGSKATELVEVADSRMYAARYSDREARGVPVMTEDERTQPPARDRRQSK